MSPVNTFGSNLRVETNIGGVLVDNDKHIQEKNNYNHSHHPTESWQKGHRCGVNHTTQAQVDEELLKDILIPTSEPITDTEDITKVNRRDLSIRGIHNNNNTNQQ
jgi:hypothetical protein